ncbi:hypothetical protein APE_1689 [Aeropyrum pernix K1]|uniref:Uncharacterized protein n=1 Tax=Aeropyrum pernix (strain ATCC 700893 / DSM 11879 / JCM 9820 / NBRC 100138 / K1) TaxID=272557 RepID=Q9YBA8_AERPE|nr:hypothetical protein [Aeropyrum pernix]BAA80690.1 hypothetical protein APE_1689 [Aeropyrum pernix K1]
MVKPLRRPPAIKVLEAAAALGDRRVRILAGGSAGVWVARVSSSGRPREYLVVVEPRGAGQVYAYSDDNGTRFRGYVGYPILSLMMAAGLLPRDEEIERLLSGVNWTLLNERMRSYAKVLEHLRKTRIPGEKWGRVERFMAEVLARLRGIKVYYDPSLPSKALA